MDGNELLNQELKEIIDYVFNSKDQAAYDVARSRLSEFYRKNSEALNINELYNWIGFIYYLENDWANSLSNYILYSKTIFEDSPNYSETHFNMAKILFLQGKYDDAVLEIQKIIKNAKKEEFTSTVPMVLKLYVDILDKINSKLPEEIRPLLNQVLELMELKVENTFDLNEVVKILDQKINKANENFSTLKRLVRREVDNLKKRKYVEEYISNEELGFYKKMATLRFSELLDAS